MEMTSLSSQGVLCLCPSPVSATHPQHQLADRGTSVLQKRWDIDPHGCRESREGRKTQGMSQAAAGSGAAEGGVVLLSLPPELLRRILSCLPYDDLATTVRLINKHFDGEVKQLLNSGFSRVEKWHGQLMAAVKAQLPRRESERRNHALSRHNDILTAVETRISLMGMTWNKYVDAGLCCFIPGKVLDELSHVLRIVKGCLKNGEQPARPHELLQELRDISSMAMEYFEEKIGPQLREAGERAEVRSPGSFGLPLGLLNHPYPPPPLTALPQANSPGCSTPRLPFGNFPCFSPSVAKMYNLSNELGKLKQKCATQSKTILVQKKETTNLKAEVATLKKRVTAQNRIAAEQNRKMEEFAKKYETLLAELRAEVRAPAEPHALPAPLQHPTHDSDEAPESQGGRKTSPRGKKRGLAAADGGQGKKRRTSVLETPSCSRTTRSQSARMTLA